VALAQGLGLKSRSHSAALSTAVYERRQPHRRRLRPGP